MQTNVGYDRSAQGIAHMMGNITTLLEHNIRGIRMNGSAALEMCNVACGRMVCPLCLARESETDRGCTCERERERESSWVERRDGERERGIEGESRTDK